MARINRLTIDTLLSFLQNNSGSYFLNNASKYYPLDGDMVNIEQWIYNPNYFSKNGCIDTFDAYIVLSKRYKKHGDPRIEKALKKLERMIVNG